MLVLIMMNIINVFMENILNYQEFSKKMRLQSLIHLKNRLKTILMEKESPELYEDFLPKWIIYYGKPIPSDQPTSAPTGLFLHSKYELPSSPNITDDAYGELDHHLYPVHHRHRDPIYYETRQQFELDHSHLSLQINTITNNLFMTLNHQFIILVNLKYLDYNISFRSR